MRILICPELCKLYNNYAKYLLKLFVEKCEKVYSKYRKYMDAWIVVL